MKQLRVRPKLDFRLLGTSCTLSCKEVYIATPAVNIPDWEKGGLVFVGKDGILLHRHEYDIITEQDHG